MRKDLVLAVMVSLLLLAAGSLFAADIVTVPTANQLRAGEVDLAVYYLALDKDSLVPALEQLDVDCVRFQTLYVGISDQLELDAHRADVDVLGAETIWNATVLIQPEGPEKPAVVIGGRNLSRVYDQHASYFVSAAKTLNPPVAGPPSGPIVRLHVSVGTEDNTLFLEERHEGLFGGIQAVLRPVSPMVGMIALYDGQDLITGLTCVPQPGWPTIKAGTFGGHWWVGISHTFNAKQ